MTEYLSSFDYELLADALDVLDPDGSEATRRKQELEAWARSMAATGRGYLPPAADELDTLRKAIGYGESFATDWVENEGKSDPEAIEAADIVERAGEIIERLAATPAAIRVLVAIEGGLVQGAVADRPGVSVITIDYDTEGADADEVLAIPQDDGSTSSATMGGCSAEYDPAWIDAAEAAELAEPEEAIARMRRRAKQYEEHYPEIAAENRAKADALEAKLASEEAPQPVVA